MTFQDILASLYLLKAKILESMDKRSLAVDNYVMALQKSVYLTEALDALLQHEMLMAWEESELINSIMPLKQQCNNETDMAILKHLYEQKLKKYYKTSTQSSNPERTPSNSQFINTLNEKIRMSGMQSEKRVSTSTLVRGGLRFTPHAVMSPANKILFDLKNTSHSSFSIHASLTRCAGLNTSRTVNNSKIARGTTKNSTDFLTNEGALKQLEESVDVKVSKAEELFYNCEYKKCLKIVNEILERDPYHKRTLFVQIGCLMELKDTNGELSCN